MRGTTIMSTDSAVYYYNDSDSAIKKGTLQLRKIRMLTNKTPYTKLLGRVGVVLISSFSRSIGHT